MIVGDITLNELISEGAFSKIYLSTKNGPSIKYATKVVDKNYYKEFGDKKYFDDQIKILKDLNHPNIANLIEMKEDDKNFYYVHEYCNGGSLAKFVEEYYAQNKKGLPEEIVQYIMRQVLDAINYIHNKNIIYRNVKLENLLIHYEDENDRNNKNILKGKIKMIDFLFAKYLEKGALTKTVLGSPMSMSPLLLKKLCNAPNSKKVGYDKKVDIWGLGVMTYELLVGVNPFESTDLDELLAKVNNGNYVIPATLSKESVSFLNSMIQDEPQRRLSAEKLCEHAFLKKNIQEFTKLNLEELKNHLVIQVNTKENDEISEILEKNN